MPLRLIKSAVPVLALAALFSPQACHALYKCTNSSGKVTYSEQQCATGSKVQAIGGDDGPAPNVNLQTDYYDVGGEGAPALPSGAHGTTVWNVNYTYTTRMDGGGCVVERVNTKMDARVKLPNWTGASRASAEAQAKWSRYIAALRVHEMGHVQMGRRLEEAVKKSLPGMRAQSCGLLTGATRERFEGLLKDIRDSERDYDQQTRGGATQGAFFR